MRQELLNAQEAMVWAAKHFPIVIVSRLEVLPYMVKVQLVDSGGVSHFVQGGSLLGALRAAYRQHGGAHATAVEGDR